MRGGFGDVGGDGEGGGNGNGDRDRDRDELERRRRERSVTPTPERVRGRYRLSSLVCHYGSAGWGHYVSYRRRPRTRTRTRARSRSNSHPKSTDALANGSLTHSKEDGRLNSSTSPNGNGNGSDFSEERDGEDDEEDDECPGWIRTSDSQVDYVTWDQVRRETSGVFLLFYERVSPGPGPSSYSQQPSQFASASASNANNVLGESMTSLVDGVDPLTGSWIHGPGAGMGYGYGLGLLASSVAGVGLGLSASMPDLHRSLNPPLNPVDVDVDPSSINEVDPLALTPTNRNINITDSNSQLPTSMSMSMSNSMSALDQTNNVGGGFVRARTITRAELDARIERTRQRSPSLSSQETVRPKPPLTHSISGGQSQQNQNQNQNLQGKGTKEKGKDKDKDKDGDKENEKGTEKVPTMTKEDPGSRYTTYIVSNPLPPSASLAPAFHTDNHDSSVPSSHPHPPQSKSKHSSLSPSTPTPMENGK